MRSSLFAILAAGLLAGCGSTGDGAPSAVSGGFSSTSTLMGGESLGIAGKGGVSEEALGTDVVTPVLGDSGTLGKTVGGGSAGILAGNLSTEALSSVPVLGELAGQLPIEGGILPPEATAVLTDGLAQISAQAPALGVSGEGGLGEDLLGNDITGTLVGVEGGLVPTLLSGGNDGPLGSALPDGSAPLAPVGDVLASALDGAEASPREGNLNGLEPVLSPIILSATGASSDTPGGLPLGALPLDQVVAAAAPVVTAITPALATALPNGTTAYDVVFPVVLGTAAGIAGATLPLETIGDAAAGVVP